MIIKLKNEYKNHSDNVYSLSSLFDIHQINSGYIIHGSTKPKSGYGKLIKKINDAYSLVRFDDTLYTSTRGDNIVQVPILNSSFKIIKPFLNNFI